MNHIPPIGIFHVRYSVIWQIPRGISDAVDLRTLSTSRHFVRIDARS
jgi:hypothetical protein